MRPDNRTLAYASERGGNWQLYLAKIARKEDPNFPNATLIEEEVLLPSTTVERAYPQFSPDGKELAFIEDRIRLMVLNLETKKVRQITDGSTWYSTGGGFDYAWSPDGKWFTLEFTGNKHDPYSDIGLVSAEGGKDIINLTNSGYMSGYPHFALDGNAILFTTERYGMRAHASWGSLNDAMLVFLNQDAYDKYCLNKEDYELRKELEAEQKKAQSKDTAKGKKGSKKDAGQEKAADDDKAQVKDITVELKTWKTAWYASPRIPRTWAASSSPKTVRPFITLPPLKAVTTFGKWISARKTPGCFTKWMPAGLP